MHCAVLRTHEYVCRVGNSLISPDESRSHICSRANIVLFAIHKHFLVFDVVIVDFSVVVITSSLATLTSHNFIFISIEMWSSLLLCSLRHIQKCGWRVCLLPNEMGKTSHTHLLCRKFAIILILLNYERWNGNMIWVCVNLRMSGLRRKYVRKYLWWKQFDKKNQKPFRTHSILNWTKRDSLARPPSAILCKFVSYDTNMSCNIAPNPICDVITRYQHVYAAEKCITKYLETFLSRAFYLSLWWILNGHGHWKSCTSKSVC